MSNWCWTLGWQPPLYHSDHRWVFIFLNLLMRDWFTSIIFTNCCFYLNSNYILIFNCLTFCINIYFNFILCKANWTIASIGFYFAMEIKIIIIVIHRQMTMNAGRLGCVRTVAVWTWMEAISVSVTLVLSSPTTAGCVLVSNSRFCGVGISFLDTYYRSIKWTTFCSLLNFSKSPTHFLMLLFFFYCITVFLIPFHSGCLGLA